MDYSKWDHIEISDDEDDIHPNIDTPSLFRWRHQARMDRMEEQRKEKESIQNSVTDLQRKKAEMKKKLEEAETGQLNMDKIKLEVEEIEKQEKEWRKKEEEFAKKERLTPLNVDTLSHDAWQKTIINKPPAKPTNVILSEEEQEKKQREFIKKYEKDIKKFGIMKKWDVSKAFMEENRHLVCEETANYLVIWCIDLEVEEKHELMSHVAHQTIVMQYLLELAKQLDVDPRACIGSFFTKIKTADKVYLDAFEDELRLFKGRVKERAEARIERAMKEYEEEEKQKRLGPGGLDPVEVFESLPQILKSCFETQDIPLLQKTLLELPESDARYHMKRCVDSGLWVPEASAKEELEKGMSKEEVGKEEEKKKAAA
ncbi:PREDICTED: hsp90 co-chaperone Cdc37-like [Priapulus caudatus]|uniref:Hsp90 chaperone protein kinase-targeting subunit n=1 Tax=Priapulus caudatus TaxID=37621 RepID=A0ABM1EWS7_PRICU|nr:PREDICTED: hsp90 co-chaperone Cdc37-like [Priapulus caudatus]